MRRRPDPHRPADDAARALAFDLPGASLAVDVADFRLWCLRPATGLLTAGHGRARWL